MTAADFDPVAALYASARPSYPREVVDWLVPQTAGTVADVGAGTGLFTRLLERPGRTIVAIEPSAAMLDELRVAIPHAVAMQGTGERMPLAEASIDAVVFAQAWHWVDVGTATAEVARVLRPGGTLGLVWNLRDERVPWVRALGAAMRADGDHYRGEVDDPLVGDGFEGPERRYVEWMRECTRSEILADVRSRSYFALLSPAEQDAVLADVSAVLPEAEPIALPYVTAAFRYVGPN
ncbi:MAG: class I SAM-dependent methyltransferase [Microbacterium sp.]